MLFTSPQTGNICVGPYILSELLPPLITCYIYLSLMSAITHYINAKNPMRSKSISLIGLLPWSETN